jgi:hypothetical protein
MPRVSRSLTPAHHGSRVREPLAMVEDRTDMVIGSRRQPGSPGCEGPCPGATRLVGLLALLVSCSGPAAPASPAPAVPAAPPATSTVCYAGVTTGLGQRVRTIMRRTVDPTARQIVEDVSHGDAGSHRVTQFHVVMDVAVDRFTMKETGGAFTGTGTLTGEPWQWTSWISTSQLAGAGIEVESDGEITETGIKIADQIRKDGKVVGTTAEQLAPFDCAEWDKATAVLATPVLDRAMCDRACRNYASLKYWSVADGEIARLPTAARDDARQQKSAELATKLETGMTTCVTRCLSADNAAQTACMGDAKSLAQLAACDTE